MGSRYARNLYNPKIKRLFEIGPANFEVILFIHFYPLKKALGWSQRHFLKIVMMDYCLPFQMKTYGNFFLIFINRLKRAISAFLKNWQNGTFLPVHENQTFFGPNVFIWSGKQGSIIKFFRKWLWLFPSAFLSG